MKNDKKVTVQDLRDNLKLIVQNEINILSEQLEALEPKERLNFLVKIMPYVFPKVESVHHSENEVGIPIW